MYKRRNVTTWVVLLLIVLGSSIVVSTLSLRPQLRRHARMASARPASLNLQSIDNGTYRGSYTYDRFGASVAVEMYDGELIRIDILSVSNPQYLQKLTDLANRVIVRQSLEVDAVSGATASSSALLKAIEHALTTEKK
jgi:uncharacterized protein with FMN-binding domain